MKEYMEQLTRQLEQHSYNYYVLDQPTITDFEYDRLLHELMRLEEQYPQYKSSNSPTQRVGGAVLQGFQTVTHAVPMESLADAFSKQELLDFDASVRKSVSDPQYVVEMKIDGLSVSLEYENGEFVRGSTRGDGVTGEDVNAEFEDRKGNPAPLKGAGPLSGGARGGLHAGTELYRVKRAARDAGTAVIRQSAQRGGGIAAAAGQQGNGGAEFKHFRL